MSNDRLDIATWTEWRSLLTRDQGLDLLKRILTRLEEHEQLTIDLSSAEAMSPSFVDELFGGLESALGPEFQRKIQIVCPRPEWRSLISSALGYRRAKAAS